MIFETPFLQIGWNRRDIARDGVEKRLIEGQPTCVFRDFEPISRDKPDTHILDLATYRS